MPRLRFAAHVLSLIAGSGSRLPAQQPPISEFEKIIPQLMRDQNVPGLAIAVVDEREVLWCRCFGVTDYASKQPITPDTMSSIQSMSKTFTATAVLIAAQEGLVCCSVNGTHSDYLRRLQGSLPVRDSPGSSAGSG